MKQLISILLITCCLSLYSQVVAPISFMEVPASESSCWVLDPVPIGVTYQVPDTYDGTVNLSGDDCIDEPYTYIALDLPDSCAIASCYDMTCLELYDNFINGNNTCCLDTAMVFITVDPPNINLICAWRKQTTNWNFGSCEPEFCNTDGLSTLLDINPNSFAVSCTITDPLGNVYNLIPNTGMIEVTDAMEVAGDWVVNCLDDRGCPSTQVFTFSLEAGCDCDSFTCSITDVINNECDEPSDIGQFTINVQGGVSPFTYELMGTTVNGNPQFTYFNLPDGEYCVMVTDSNGCEVECCATIESNPPPTVTCSYRERANPIAGNGALGPLITDCSVIEICSDGLNDIRFRFLPFAYTSGGTITGPWGTGTISGTGYVWLTNLDVNDSGTYTVTIGTGSCQQILTIELIVNVCTPPCELSCNVDQIIGNECGEMGNGSISISLSDGTAPYTWQIAGGTPFTNSNTSETFTGLDTQNYCVTITDSANCMTVCCADVENEGPPIFVDITGDLIICDGQISTITTVVTGGTPAFTYLWNNGQTTAGLNITVGGIYSVTVTDDFGCSTDSSVTAIVQDSPDPNCNGTDGNCLLPATLTTNPQNGQPPYSYNWSNGAMTQNTTAGASGTYSVTVTDSNGCSSVCQTSVTVDNDEPSCSITGQDITCTNFFGSATSNVTGGSAPYAYSWSNGETTADLTGITTQGTFTLTVTDDNGCTTTCSVFIANTQVSLNVNFQTNGGSQYCEGGSVLVTAVSTNGSNPFDVEWSNGVMTAAQNFTGQSVGNYPYSVTITDSNGCTGTGSVTVNVYENPECVVDITDTSCGDNNGLAVASPFNGTPPYSYSWSTGSSSSFISGLSSGNYSLTVTDSNGCTANCSGTVAPSTGVDCEISLFSDPSCLDDGSITAQGIGGVSPYTYSWNNGASGSVISGLGTGIYFVTVTDADGCTQVCSQELEGEDCNITPNLVGCVAEFTINGTDCGLYTIQVFVDGVMQCNYNIQSTDTFFGCDLNGFNGQVTYNLIHDNNSNCNELGVDLGDVECNCDCDIDDIELQVFQFSGACDTGIIGSFCSGSANPGTHTINVTGLGPICNMDIVNLQLLYSKGTLPMSLSIGTVGATSFTLEESCTLVGSLGTNCTGIVPINLIYSLDLVTCDGTKEFWIALQEL